MRLAEDADAPAGATLGSVTSGQLELRGVRGARVAPNVELAVAWLGVGLGLGLGLGLELGLGSGLALGLGLALRLGSGLGLGRARGRLCGEAVVQRRRQLGAAERSHRLR